MGTVHIYALNQRPFFFWMNECIQVRTGSISFQRQSVNYFKVYKTTHMIQPFSILKENKPKPFVVGHNEKLHYLHFSIRILQRANSLIRCWRKLPYAMYPHNEPRMFDRWPANQALLEPLSNAGVQRVWKWKRCKYVFPMYIMNRKNSHFCFSQLIRRLMLATVVTMRTTGFDSGNSVWDITKFIWILVLYFNEE